MSTRGDIIVFCKRLAWFSLPLVAILLFIPGYNYWLDPYGVLKGDMAAQITEPNQRYLKTEFILNNPEKFNAYLFGSSRTQKIDIGKIKDGNTWYNFSYTEGIPGEILSDLKKLLENKVKVKKVLIGLEEISYLISPESHYTQSLRKSYVNSFKPYYEYFFIPPSLKLYKTIRDSEKSQFYSPGTYADLYTTGCLYENKKDAYIKKDSLGHIKDPIFDLPLSEVNFHNRTGSAIAEIKAIISLCAEHDIEYVFFMNPLHIKNYLRLDPKEYFTFLKELSAVTDFYDFSGINPVTTNNYYYYEMSHYRPMIGTKIIESIFNFTADSTFGVLVNRSNVDSILKQKETELNAYKTEKLK